MTTATASLPVQPRSIVSSWIHRLRPLGVVAVVLIGLTAVTSIAGPIFLPEPTAISREGLQGPSWSHWFGTDPVGRDYLSRVVAGLRVSLFMAVSAITISLVIALSIGMISAYFRGIVDLVVQRLVDVLLAFPGLILIMVLASAFGTGRVPITLALGLLLAPGMSRLVRGSTLSILAEPYVEGARVVGAGTVRILLRYVLPNIAPTIFVYATVGLGTVVLAEGALSFLGLGVAPPTPSLGRMLAESRANWREPWLGIFPGLAITLVVLGFNLLGDALRDTWDPRLRAP